MEMARAVMSKTKYHKGNTKVYYDEKLNISDIWLHDNHIADYYHATNVLAINKYTLDRWPTRTTTSRLRALGANVYIKQGKIKFGN